MLADCSAALIVIVSIIPIDRLPLPILLLNVLVAISARTRELAEIIPIWRGEK
jgi:hypothetical protein